MNTPLLIERVADTTSHRDRDELNRSIVRLLQQFLDARLVALYAVIEQGRTKRVVCRAGLTHEQEELPPDLTDDLRKLPELTERRAWHECVTTGDFVETMCSDGLCRCVFPLEGEREITGMLEVVRTEPLEPRDASLVRGILRILKNQLSLLDYGERDTLTGLLNRKTFETRFDKVARALRVDDAEPMLLPTWLGLVDIDHFKSINDSHGHLFGDEVLLLASQIMARTLRSSDQLFRFGGEEFVIMLEAMEASGARSAFERVRKAIATYVFPQIGRVTISLGYTPIRPQDVPATCIERADAALYYAKRAGRNETRDYEELIAAGDLAGPAADGEVELF
jgi:diguanylate cyclase (GGDEF)-like protein